MPHILIVCTANICRSPVGEALLRDRLQKRGLHDWAVSSAGTWAKQVRGASQYSIQLMAEQGLDISAHQAQMVTAEHLADADLVLCMEVGHAEALKIEFPEYAEKIYLLSEMIGRRFSINDPYGGEIEDYRIMVAELTEIIDEGLDRIIELATRHAVQS
ncbi:MAG: low molecular weight protein arginine phosphatase [Chloroflexi bacterium]|nr:MAG: low molecular weight protein arginine phosphatase [Chloroflexota bacterium]